MGDEKAPRRCGAAAAAVRCAVVLADEEPPSILAFLLLTVSISIDIDWSPSFNEDVLRCFLLLLFASRGASSSCFVVVVAFESCCRVVSCRAGNRVAVHHPSLLRIDANR